MSKNEEIKAYLEEHKQALLAADTTTATTPNGICFDGIVDESVFENQDKKLIFLLKETNGNDETGKMRNDLGEWDYRAWLQNQQANGFQDPNNKDGEKFYGKTFYNLCMWVDIFSDMICDKELLSFAEYHVSRFNETNYQEVLKKTAIVNLKKTWGSGDTKWSSLNDYLRSEAAREAVRFEIGTIEPNVVMCGGRQVFDFAKQIFGADELHLDLRSGAIHSYFRWKQTIFLDFYHPSCRKRREVLYDAATQCFTAFKQII